MTGTDLLALLVDYPTAVLTWVEADGYPVSIRCSVRRIAGSDRLLEFASVPGSVAGQRGPACLLFHMHDAHLEGLRQMLVKGVLVDGPGPAGTGFAVSDVVTANGRPDTDRMPHAGAPLHMLQFLRLGRRQARAYLRKREEPWPPIPYEEIARAVRADPARAGSSAHPPGRPG